MTTLSNGTDTITPELTTGFRSSRRPNTITHKILDRSDPDVSFAPASLRRGTLELLIPGEVDSITAEQLLAAPGMWTLTDDDRPSVGMTFVVDNEGEIERELEDESRDAWLLRFPYAEVLP